jgi:hypothetical protein
MQYAAQGRTIQLVVGLVPRASIQAEETNMGRAKMKRREAR